MEARRLRPGEGELARETFRLLVEVFGEGGVEVSRHYAERLLAREDFWAVAALHQGAVVGGLTAHTLPMTRDEASEVFIFDIAVHPDHQRQGVGRMLVSFLRRETAVAGLGAVFVPADDEDGHALDFYRALGGEEAAATIFTFPPLG